MSVLDEQVGGSHYRDLAIQPIEYIYANDIGWHEGNVIKYVTRWRKKGGIEDLRKARHFLDDLIERVKGNEQKNKREDEDETYYRNYNK